MHFAHVLYAFMRKVASDSALCGLIGVIERQGECSAGGRAQPPCSHSLRIVALRRVGDAPVHQLRDFVACFTCFNFNLSYEGPLWTGFSRAARVHLPFKKSYLNFY